MRLIQTKLYVLCDALAQLLKKLHQSYDISCTVMRKVTHAYT